VAEAEALLEALQQRGVEQTGSSDRGVRVELCAGEQREQRKRPQLVRGLGACHVCRQLANRVRVVEPARDAAAVRQPELPYNTRLSAHDTKRRASVDSRVGNFSNKFYQLYREYFAT
jgi:hypothetical protein